MKTAYPVIFTRSKSNKGWYLVDIPDIGRQTQGQDYVDAIYMARDLLGLWLTDMEDAGDPLPSPTPMSQVDVSAGAFAEEGAGEVSMVDIDTSAYRRAADAESKKSVRRNITLPAWLDFEARKANINVSRITQEALTAELGL